jgi:uncharacterized delta-60 repeat protein
MLITPNLTRQPLALLAIALCFFTAPALAQDGQLDASFGTNGTAVTNVAGVGDVGVATALQADHKIIIGGYTTIASTQYFALVRHLPNGIVDSSFGTNGRAIAGFSNNTLLSLTALAVQPDGKIIAAGYIVNSLFALVRFNTNGTIDSSFGTDGRVLTAFAGQHYIFCNAMALQSDGYIVTAGNVGCDIGICRYKPNGVPDSTFGTNGQQVIDAGGCDKANAIAIQPDKKIIIAGGSTTGITGVFLLLRITATGVVDSSFGTNGKTLATPRATYNEISSCALQADGKIVAGGTAKYFSTAFALGRYTADGLPDSTFGTNGLTQLQFAGDNYPRSLALQANQKIVFGGWVNDGGTLEIALARFNTNGLLDSTFGYKGQVLTQNNNGNFGYSLVIQPDAKIVVGGYTYNASTGNDFAVTRYNASNGVLTAALVTFTGKMVKPGVVLNWTTANEVNSSHFLIERSFALQNFVPIGKVASAGNSIRQQQYTFTDAQPLTGDNFYRLKLVDKNGTFTYSKVIHFVVTTTPYLLSVYPNPTASLANIGGLSAGAKLTVINAQGKTMQQHTATQASYAINLQQLAAGIYFVRVIQGGKTTTLKLVKQ